MLRSFTTFLVLVAAGTATGQQAAPQADDSLFQKPSVIVSSALDVLAKAGSSVDLNKWKAPNNVKEEVDSNLGSIQKDLQATLPPLLVTADAAPASPSASMPVLMNISALYDVLLRVVIASHNGAPRDQASALDQAAITLDNARRDLADQVRGAMLAQERSVRTLQATVQQQAKALQAAQAPPPPPATTAAKPAAKKRKPAAKPAATPAAATPPASAK